MGDGMVMIWLVGNVDPQTSAVCGALANHQLLLFDDPEELRRASHNDVADLIVVAGWRHLIPADVLANPRLGTVGFHSAKLPEYPGRAPVPWTLLRGDSFAYNTMLFLDEGVDSGDIIDERVTAVMGDDTPETLYDWMAMTAVDMLLTHLPALLAGTAPRTPQDQSRRGPLTTKDGWDRLRSRDAVVLDPR